MMDRKWVFFSRQELVDHGGAHSFCSGRYMSHDGLCVGIEIDRGAGVLAELDRVGEVALLAVLISFLLVLMLRLTGKRTPRR